MMDAEEDNRAKSNDTQITKELKNRLVTGNYYTVKMGMVNSKNGNKRSVKSGKVLTN